MNTSYDHHKEFYTFNLWKIAFGLILFLVGLFTVEFVVFFAIGWTSMSVLLVAYHAYGMSKTRAA